MSLQSIWQNAKDCYNGVAYEAQRGALWIFRKTVNFYTLNPAQQEEFFQAWVQLTMQIETSSWMEQALDHLKDLNKPVFIGMKYALKAANLTMNKIAFDMAVRDMVEYHNFCAEHRDISLAQIKNMIASGQVQQVQIMNNPLAGLSADQMFMLVQLLEFRTYGRQSSQQR